MLTKPFPAHVSSGIKSIPPAGTLFEFAVELNIDPSDTQTKVRSDRLRALCSEKDGNVVAEIANGTNHYIDSLGLLFNKLTETGEQISRELLEEVVNEALSRHFLSKEENGFPGIKKLEIDINHEIVTPLEEGNIQYVELKITLDDGAVVTKTVYVKASKEFGVMKVAMSKTSERGLLGMIGKANDKLLLLDAPLVKHVNDCLTTKLVNLPDTF